ncbi:MAG: hypothetical protein U0132_01805 [Gemmatimonadaceae bacterium]
MKAETTHDGSKLGDMVRKFLRRALGGAPHGDAPEDEFKMAHLFSISEMERERYAGRRFKASGKRTTPVFSRPLGVPDTDAEVEMRAAVEEHRSSPTRPTREPDDVTARGDSARSG